MRWNWIVVNIAYEMRYAILTLLNSICVSEKLAMLQQLPLRYEAKRQLLKSAAWPIWQLVAFENSELKAGDPNNSNNSILIARFLLPSAKLIL